MSCNKPLCKPYTQPCTTTLWPRCQASETTVVRHTLRACSSTLSSTKASTRRLSSKPIKKPACASRTSCTWRNQLSTRPARWLLRAARMPPQLLWPTTMMCCTPSTSTAYWMTLKALRSEWTNKLATLRCTNNSPGKRSTSSLAGTRLSAQPSHMYLGCCWESKPVKNPGVCASVAAAHCRLRSNSSLRSLLMAWAGLSRFWARGPGFAASRRSHALGHRAHGG